MTTNNKPTIGETYGPAMTITEPKEAQAYFEKLVQQSMEMWGNTREQAEAQERANLGYYAGYYDSETARRVQRLFGGIHPVFGPVG